MKADSLKNIDDVVKVQVETDRESLKSILSENKIVVTITKGFNVLTRMVKVATGSARKPSRKAETVPDEARRKIKTVRTLVKNNADAMTIFVLIEKMKVSIKNLNLKDMTPEAAAMFNGEIRDLILKLSSTQKLLIGKSK